MVKALRPLIFLLALSGAAQEIRMEGGVFRVEGWRAGQPPAGGWETVFPVYAGAGDVPPLLGKYTVEDGVLVFRPRFPLAPGLRALAVFHPPDGAPVEAVFTVPKSAPPPSSTRVEHVYPSTGTLPENALKLYLYFSAPMRQGEAWQHIQLLDAAGRRVELPFIELDQELWDREGKRLTVLFDPGRIKRGLLPLRELGPSIIEGKRYTLVIDRDWPDARGAPLEREFRKEYRVGPPDRTSPDPAAWRVTPPAAGSTGALAVDFPEPLDYALLQHVIDVQGPEGAVTGAITVEREETEWRFTPGQPWRAGSYRLVIHTALEDLAGNQIGRAFDVDTFAPIARQPQRETVSLPFRIGE